MDMVLHRDHLEKGKSEHDFDVSYTIPVSTGLRSNMTMVLCVDVGCVREDDSRSVQDEYG